MPKATLEGFGVSAPSVTPTPEIGRFRLGLEPFDVTVTFPLTEPGPAGANFTVKDVLCPALSVTGIVMPLTLNPLPVADAAEMVTLLPPLLVRVTDWLPVEPTVTLPKVRLEGFGLRLPAVVPVPATGMFKVGFEPFDEIVTLPLTAPPLPGANVTVHDALWPEFSIRGREGPLTLNPVPVADADEIVTLLPPLLVIVTD